MERGNHTCQCGAVEWMKMETCPSYFEGVAKLCWHESEGIHIRVVPVGFSRVPDHCKGWWVSHLPAPPDLCKSDSR